MDEEIEKVWNSSKHQKPKIFIIYFEKQYMAIVDDSTDFIRFIRASAEVYLAISKYCTISYDNNIKSDIYICEKAVPILCSPYPGTAGIIDNFVLGKITPILENLTNKI